MARPKKATVDYFPHMTEHGSTIFILQSRWGNDGYAAWFKLLERLGCSDGMFIDCRNAGTWHFLQAYTGVTDDVLTDILDTLAQLCKIDPSLWSNKIIYCQQLVDGVTDAFRRRKESTPTRANTFIICGLAPAEFMTAEIPLNEFMTAETPLNEHKPQNSGVYDGRSTERERERERERKTTSSPSLEIPPAAGEVMTRRTFSGLYQQTFGKMMPGMLNHESGECCKRYPPDKIIEAFRISAENGAGSWSYTKAVLEGTGKKASDPLGFLREMEAEGLA